MSVTAADLAFVHQLADASGAAIRPFFRKKIAVTDKGQTLFDPVTEADKGAERAIRALLQSKRPEDGILGEEYGEVRGVSGRTWVIDPVDGTRAFITGQTLWATLIGLYENGKSVLGVIDQPVVGERFIGCGGESFLFSAGMREKLAVRACASLSEAVLIATDPWRNFTEVEKPVFWQVADRCRLSRFGCDCYAYALLAMGFVDLVVEAGLKPWDLQALIPVVEGAGGIVTDWRGNPNPREGRVIAAGDKRVHAEALQLLGKAS
jgi:myo-inositol-1(or 4)-monophosphatase